VIYKYHLKNQGVEWRVILKWIFKTWDGESLIGLIWLRIGAVAGHF
jgi:hypothetical protein